MAGRIAIIGSNMVDLVTYTDRMPRKGETIEAPEFAMGFGGKGSNLAEMANLGLPVPPGFTITTEVCTYYYANKQQYPKELKDQVEKALVQMRSPRPESTRGTLNVTLAAHRFVLAERHGDEPLWQTIDRLVDELIRLRQRAAAQPAAAAKRPMRLLCESWDSACGQAGPRVVGACWWLTRVYCPAGGGVGQQAARL